MMVIEELMDLEMYGSMYLNDGVSVTGYQVSSMA